jgi:signal peptidase
VARRIGAALLIVFLAIAALLVMLAVIARQDSKGVTRVAGHPVLTVLSGSMTPTFRAGDLVIDSSVSESQANRLVVGDVITYRLGPSSELVTHRIIKVHQTTDGVTYTTQGDANNIADSQPVTPAQVVGTYSKRIPFGGYALRAAHSRSGLFLLVFLPVLALIGGEFARRWRTVSPSASEAATAVTPSTDDRKGVR